MQSGKDRRGFARPIEVNVDLDSQEFEEIEPFTVCLACYNHHEHCCPHCENNTTAEELIGDGCSHCGLGVETSKHGLGISCDCCHRIWSDEADWDDALAKLNWKYGLEPNEWHMMCPHCQEDDELRAYWDKQADEEWLYLKEEAARKAMKKVVSKIPKSARKYIERAKNRLAFDIFMRFCEKGTVQQETVTRPAFAHAQKIINDSLA